VKKAESGLITIRTCHTSSGEAPLQPNTKYTVYTVLPGSNLNQPSSVVTGNTLESGQYKQTGNLVYQSSWDTAEGMIPVGETLKVNLEHANAGTGTWTWFVSVQDYLGVTEGTDPDWTQLVSGYVPTSDGGSSLTLTEELAGHYVRAEFTADPKGGYAGTIDQDGAGNHYYDKYVRKIYKETITLESSTSDGYGAPAAYQNTVLTGTVNDFAEKTAVTGTRTVTFQANGTDITVTVNQDPGAVNKFTCTLPLMKEWDEKLISASVTVPFNKELYVTEDKKPLTAAKITSVTDSNAGVPYRYGIPISTGRNWLHL